MKRSLIFAAFAIACAASSLAAASSAPTFFTRRDYPGASTFVAVADTNGDGIPDIIPMGGLVLFGSGNGTFRPGPQEDFSFQQPGAMALADLNGDGKVDVILSGGPPYGIGVCFGNGDGTFQPAVFYPVGTGSTPGAVVLGDFNGDGITDVATVNQSGIWLFTGKGGGVFNPGVLTPLTGLTDELVAADFNGDGKLDLAITSTTGFVVVLGNGDGTFQPPIAISAAPFSGRWITAGDLNGDGHPDIVLSPRLLYGNSPNYLDVYLGNGNGGFSAPTKVYMPGLGQITIGDVNGDHIPDLVSGLGYIALGNGNGTFKPPIYYPLPTGGTVTNAALADLRNNGLTDIVFQDGNLMVSVLLSEGKGKFEDGEWTPVTGGAGCGAAADYNGDGKPDLAVNTAQGVSILLGTGKSAPPFTTGTTIALPNAACLVTGDLNGDGIPDLLVPAQNAPPAAASTMYAYLGNGDGTFTQKSATALSTPGFIVLADFNGDGKLDFATSGNLLALGNGDGTFQTPAPFVPKVLPATQRDGFDEIAVGDLNGDGWPDLVLTDFWNSYIYVLLNNRHGGFTENVFQEEIGSLFQGPTQIALVDVNGDGKLDMVVRLGLIGGVAIYLGNGQGGFTYESELVASNNTPNAGILAVSDVNGDGIPDILLSEGNSLTIFLGEGHGGFAVPTYYFGEGPNPGDVVVMNLHGQAASAGVPDIVVPDGSGGVMTLVNQTKK
jgi:hypothetical protein